MNRGITFILIILILTVTYAFFRSFSFIKGPKIEILNVKYDEVFPQKVTIEGEVTNSTFLTLNDKRIYPDSEGYFKEENIFPIGYSIIEVYSENRQNRKTQIHIPINTHERENK